MKKRIDREQWIKDNFIICDCGYCNNKRRVDFYGNCICCGRILNDKAWFKHNMFIKLRLWKGTKWR